MVKKVGILLATLYCNDCYTQSEDVEDLYLSYGNDETISLATGYKQNISDAPAIATVVTEDEIRSSGATTIDEVLARITGVHVSKNPVYDNIYVFRSIYNELNPHVLFMVDGVATGDAVQGGRPIAWNYPVNNIHRIEVIRGPSSALYGADAFAGTVNIITKTASNIPPKGVEMGVVGGSFDTVGTWILGGVDNDSFELSGYAESRTTNGHKGLVSVDAQSSFDAALGTRASLAPGPINAGRKDTILQVDLKKGGWHWGISYQGLIDKQSGMGNGLALDSDGDIDMNLITTSTSYDTMIGDELSITAKASYVYQQQKSFFRLFPPGAFGVFDIGVLNQLEVEVNDIRSDIGFKYYGFDAHTVSGGAGFTYQEIFNIKDKRNFIRGSNGVLMPASSLIDTRELGVLPAAFDKGRLNYFGYIQEEWRFANDWTLTTGVRVDKYRGFNVAVNPKASLVWNITPSLTAKLLYGRAFRVPTFLESTEGEWLISKGNPALQPETIDTGEVGLIERWNSYQITRLNAYYYETKDFVSIVFDSAVGVPTFRNARGSRGYGFEAEHEMVVTPSLKVRMNYAFQKAEAKTNDTPSGRTPEHQAYFETEWQFLPAWYLDLSMK